MDQSTLIREKLAELLEKEEEWTRAAQVLAGIDLDSGERGGHTGSSRNPTANCHTRCWRLSDESTDGTLLS